jgi:hypothetical protein
MSLSRMTSSARGAPNAPVQSSEEKKSEASWQILVSTQAPRVIEHGGDPHQRWKGRDLVHHPKYQVSRGIFGVWVDGSGRTDHANVHVEFIDYATFQGEWEAAILKIDKFYFNILLPEIACPTPKGVTPRDINQHVLATGTGEYRTWPMSAKSIVLTAPAPEPSIILITPAREPTSGGIGGEASRLDLENSGTISRPSKRPRLCDSNLPIVRSSSPELAAAAAKENGSSA